MELGLTLGIAYTKEPRELREAALDGSVVVTNARVEVSRQVIWRWRVVWGESRRGRDRSWGDGFGVVDIGIVDVLWS